MKTIVRAGHEHDPDQPKLLYHYTDGDGLLGIVNSKTLWATKIQYLNDVSELNHAISVATDVISNLEKEESSNALVPVTRFLRGIREKFERFEKINIFVCSFSYEHDLLSQWRAYCHDGGYALGFDAHIIHGLARAQGFRFVKCVYDRTKQKNIIRRIMKKRLFLFKEELKTENDPKGISDLIDRSSWRAVVQLMIVSPQFKNPYFTEEAEYRLISGFTSSDEETINCRNKGNLLIPYQEFKLETPEIKFEIAEIVIGPGLPIKLAMDALTNLFDAKKRKYGFISHTSIPYRKWS